MNKMQSYIVKLLALPFALLALQGVALAASGGTIEAEHLKGKVEIPANPKRVVVMDYGTLDTLDALGVDAKLALPKGNLPSYLAKFRGDEYADVGGVKEFNLETINAFKPDFIIISSRQQDYYDELSAIAPVFLVNVLAGDQVAEAEKNIRLMGKVFGAEEKAENAIGEIDRAVARTKEKAKAGGKKAIVLLANDGKISAYGSGSRFGIIHDALDVAQADSKIKVGIHGQLVNYEYIAMKNPDIIFVIDRSAAIGTRAKGTRLLDNALVDKTSAAKNGAIIMLDPECWYLSGGGIQSLSKMVSEIENAVDKK